MQSLMEKRCILSTMLCAQSLTAFAALFYQRRLIGGHLWLFVYDLLRTRLDDGRLVVGMRLDGGRLGVGMRLSLVMADMGRLGAPVVARALLRAGVGTSRGARRRVIVRMVVVVVRAALVGGRVVTRSVVGPRQR